MIEEQARVIRVDGNIAEIVIERQSACGSCNAKSGCGTSLLANWFPRRQLTMRFDNVIDAKAGDRVILGMDEAMLQRGSLLLYALPLAGLLVGAIIGEHGSRSLGLPAELGAVLLGLLGVIATLIFVRRHSAAMNQRGDSGVRLLRVVHRSESFVLGKIVTPGTNQPQGFGTNQ